MLMNENRNRLTEFCLKGKVVFLASNNIHKYQESKAVLSEFGIALGMLRVKGHEIQSESLKEIAQENAKDAFALCSLPIIVEDAGLFVDALHGFPGPYAAYAYKTLGNAGILKLMEDITNRKAKFQSAIAYCDSSLKDPICFEGTSEGEIIREERSGNGQSGFGFDPIFRPERNRKTFAEMTIAEKNGFSHRADAIRKFAKWYKSLR
jgi:XTP/dITP diphosphohydrolase